MPFDQTWKACVTVKRDLEVFKIGYLYRIGALQLVRTWALVLDFSHTLLLI